MFIGLLTPQARAQTETLSPLTEDQDGDGELLNEEIDIRLLVMLILHLVLLKRSKAHLELIWKQHLPKTIVTLQCTIYQANVKNRLQKVLM